MLGERVLMSRRARIVLALMGAAMGLLGAVAYAVWPSNGIGFGSAITGTLQPVKVSALAGGDAPDTLLLPGGTADVILRVNNPNPDAITLVSVSLDGTITADSGHPGCTTTGVTFTDQSGLTIPIAASGTTLVHLADAASMSLDSSNGCQGATFTIPVSITVHAP